MIRSSSDLKGKWVTIVVPTYNEAENVMTLLWRITAACYDLHVEVLFVDDSPGFKTSAAIQAGSRIFESDHCKVRLLRRTGFMKQGGLSGAVIDGIRQASSDTIIVMDGDLQHPPEVIPLLLPQAGEHDLVVASRYAEGGDNEGLSDSVRRFVSRGSTFLAKIMFPGALKKVNDPMTGFFLIHRDAILLERLQARGFKILLEIIVRHPDLRITEIPFHFAKRHAGESKADVNQGFAYLQQLITLELQSYADRFRALPRLVQFAVIGGGVFLVGLATLFVLVDIFGWHPVPANGLQLGLTFALNYLLNRFLTWHDRTTARETIMKFLISRGATTLLNYFLFAWLVSWQAVVTVAGQTYNLEFHYLLANIICVGLVTVINFVVSDRWVFRDTQNMPARMAPTWLRRTQAIVVVALVMVLLYTLAGRENILAVLLTMAGIIMFTQASMELWRMSYVYRVPEAVDQMRFPRSPRYPRERFCLIVPARHEEAVISATLTELSHQTHPDVTIVTVICHDDLGTLEAAHKAAADSDRIVVLTYHLPEHLKPSKPLQLNYALEWMEGKGFTVTGVIDAEDTVHPELLVHIDRAFHNPDVGIVQGGVQLMNHDSRWFTLHNTLEYWRWYSSIMRFQADHQFVPLGGNTVFVRYELLRSAGGWPISLTEDCALGVLLSSKFNTRVATYYEARLATREEAPVTLHDFFFQRVRWVQGFFNEWRRGNWRELPTLKRRLMARYILANPVFLASISLIIPMSFLAILFLKAPVGFVLMMYAPLVPLLLQLLLNAVYLHDFGKAFGRKITADDYANLFATHFVYQVLLNAAALWAVVRELRGDTSWHKTTHSGHHRNESLITDAELVPEGDAA